MASASCHCRTGVMRCGFLSGIYLSDHGAKLYRTWVPPIAVSGKSNLIRCCIQGGKKKLVNVVGVGSRSNAILDFCLDSPLVRSSSVEFWSMCSGASEEVQFFIKEMGNSSFSIEGAIGEVLDGLLAGHSLSFGSIIVLVAGTGVGSDDKAVVKLLKTVKSNDGLAVSIIMKPFSFEGQRRQREVDKLIARLSQISNLSIVVDSDALLKRETVTLTEAFKIANNVVLLAIKSVSALLSGSCIKVLHVMPDQSKVMETSDVLNLLQRSGKAVVGFGAGFSVKASVERAIFDCPFLGSGLVQGMKDTVICTVSSAQVLDEKDVEAAVCAFRQIANSSGRIICSTVLESTLEPNVIVSTIIITGVERYEASPNLSFWSQLSLRIPFPYPFSVFWDELSSRITGSQSALLPEETSCLKKTSSTSQKTSMNNTQKPPTDDLTVTTKYHDGSASSSCSKNDDGEFKSQMSCKSEPFIDKTTSSYSPTGINDVADNHTSRKQISFEGSMVKMDQVLGFKDENVPDLDSAQETCNDNLGHLNHSGNPSAYAEERSQAIQQKSSLSTTKGNFSSDSVKNAFSRENMDGNMKENPVATAMQDERTKTTDETSGSKCIDIGLECPEEQDKSTNNSSYNTEFAAACAGGSIPLPTKMDKEGLFCWSEELDLSAEAWAHMRDGSQKNSGVDDCRLPIGVKPVNEKNRNYINSKFQSAGGMQIEDCQSESTQDAGLSPWNGLADAGLSAMMDIYHAASVLVLGNDTEEYRKQGSLSDRAASMLEAERGSKRKWSPVIEMQYRGGIYRGRCQGGLPEGKGHLSYTDGSFYHGLWKHGKRCGSGAFYYSSGDVFQGSWREDMMHGKGWFYFKNGDRWFADFWKGKANGEGRYYSKHGDIFFGHFQDNWRHGVGLFIESNGTRWQEIWEQGVLVHCTQLESKEQST